MTRLARFIRAPGVIRRRFRRACETGCVACGTDCASRVCGWQFLDAAAGGRAGRWRRARLRADAGFVAGQTIIVGEPKILVELGHLWNAGRVVAVTPQTLRSTGGVVRDAGRTTRAGARRAGRRGCRRGAGFVARETNFILASRVVGGHRPRFIRAVTHLAIRRTANRMRHIFRRHIRVAAARGWNRENFRQRRRVQSDIFPRLTVTRAIRTERRIIFAARVVRIVTRLTR